MCVCVGGGGGGGVLVTAVVYDVTIQLRTGQSDVDLVVFWLQL